MSLQIRLKIGYNHSILSIFPLAGGGTESNLLVTDIDGTLLKDGTLMIDPEYMTVIEKLTSKGIIFVACSGRQFISERKLFAPVCDKLLYITDGGTVVRTPHKILKVHTLPEDVWHGMCETVRNELPDCDYFIATPGLLSGRRCRKPHVSLAYGFLRI